ncbi:bifunctional methylenetetrahydrofolate dehydrogenase/methenyltetrahydrofolate cyclohydrolase FolD [Victivallis vadensis]|uniref:Bifunctional protein FolD n=2 Tax=Victivallis vadensis TaxID=172901 RepID=A0A2U1AYE3_9BACT|nr:bifunctional methylenetetrahydrofolate dehydrogenase/methenyltetrahydrofolate cyclohydrolase FolD [Victivallis vadensis]NMD88304.1 bifunctional methylenetetrahydrofolate dehydrogenase/methenyltetrahydrofolate cyclohydrolase FolD [Victivallis vadensis]PVY41464.1 methylenetetrahydrofolate dehydrogenase (NADP+)/methenyltetrahydrofolate cyclohydrolase [Victivallis vadensis]PWM87747.1 MAG: bifunctional methylenetetrahydrofolate dehydrogenase/methenyltetrahydrofolate cyclohydrolase FolD [Lentisphae
MAAKIIDGKAIARMVNEETLARVEKLKAAGKTPGLAVVLIGDDPASQVYVNSKAKKCAELGIYSDKRVLPADASMSDVLDLIDKLNRDPKIDGILVQSPPPPQIDEEKVIAAIDPDKDVDCFHERNVGKLLIGKTDGFRPCTPYGVLVLLEKSGIDPAGRHAVVIGRSNIVGKPLAAMLMQKAKGANATVTVVHSGTPDIAKYTRDADILIAAIGKPEFVTGDMIKPGAAVIDVGINRIPNPETGKNKLVGDVNFQEAVEVAGAITPVPGGVGPMTIAILMSNAVTACERRR